LRIFNSTYKKFVLLAGVCAVAISIAIASTSTKYNFVFNANEIISDIDVEDDSTKKKTISDSLKYKITDRSQAKLADSAKHEFDLKDPSNVKTNVEYDSTTGMYTISEKVGSQYFRNPSYLTMSEFLAAQGRKDEDAYWKKRASTMGTITKSGNTAPTVDLGGEIFDRLFGGMGIEVKPSGNVDLGFGFIKEKVENPLMPIRQRNYSIFDFTQDFNLNLLAKVGDKMRMNFSYNTKATFDFENQTKLGWVGKEDQIIKSVDLGQVTFPLKTTLIQGVQGLFGAKVQAQFGRLMLTGVASQQRSKKERISVKGGAQTQQFSVMADQYDMNRHFLLDQKFRSNYNAALAKFPLIESQANITKIEVWVTNRNGATNDARDVVGLMDLGEINPYRSQFKKAGYSVPANDANNEYQLINQTPGARDIANVVGALTSLGLRGIDDFEKTFARKLQANEYNFNPKLGFISLNTYLQPDDVVGVAYQYTYNGRVFQVGEFAQDVPPDSTQPKTLFVKLLKSTTNNPTLPIWDLMMKNVYSLGSGNVGKDDFRLNVIYQDPAGAEKRYLPEGNFTTTPLLQLVNLDRLNNQNDLQPDGVFDWVEGTTIFAQQGKIYFPVLEPFGEDLKYAFGGNAALEKKYLYRILYDSTQIVATMFPQLNRFMIKGTYRGAGGGEIYLGAFNVPQGSVRVTAGSTPLVENVDFRVDYSLGRVTILNQGILNSGQNINVDYENNANFSFQQQNLTGLRADYFVNKKTNIGGTIMRYTERPFGNKITLGDDPIKNTVFGLDANYQSEAPWLTRLVDKLPFYSTTAPSLINARAEVAALMPGHSKLIDNVDDGGSVYLDDFESTRSSYDLKFPLIAWNLAAVPVGAKDANQQTLFPESEEFNSLNTGKNRARLSWYNIDPCLNSIGNGGGCMPDHLKSDKEQLSNPYIYPVGVQDVFPQRNVTAFGSALTTLDLAYFPNRRGPYNFDARNINADGTLKDPSKRWAGITRFIDQSDFEQTNVEFVEFWLMDPFMNNPSSAGGSLYLNLGNISEDLIKDSRKSFENGIPYPFETNKLTQTALAQVPALQQQINFAFDNSEEARKRQDVGFDGLNDDEERTKFASYLTNLSGIVGNNTPAFTAAQNDPSNDNYKYFRGGDLDSQQVSVLERYSKFNSPEGNSPVTLGTELFSNAYTNIPESEDLNKDNTLSETEAYYQYRINLKPNMDIGTNYIINKQVTTINGLPNGGSVPVTWYQFRVPIRQYTNVIGGIRDFRSIRFMRMFLTGFEDSVILRFARLELGRNIWRKYAFSLKNPNEIVPDDDLSATTFNLTSVSVEEHSGRKPIPYAVPPGIVRQQQQVSSGQNIQLNEQSISMQICKLEDGDARGCFRSLGSNITQFAKLNMFVHAESTVGEPPLRDNDLRAFIRMGNDFTTNYYEYQIPLKVSVPPMNAQQTDLIWPAANNMAIELKQLVDVKNQRNKAKASTLLPYTVTLANGHLVKVVGNPTLGDVKTTMIGVYNPTTSDDASNDGFSKCGEVWFNELRVSGLNEQAGYAATANADIQLADLGNIKLSGDMNTIGYGNVDQKLMQRLREDAYQYNASINLNAGKLLPKSWGVTLPVFAGQNSKVITPQYDPFDTDNELKTKLKELDKPTADSVRNVSQDVVTVQSLNFQNITVRPVKANKTGGVSKISANSPGRDNAMGGQKIASPIAWQNFNASYSFTRTKKHNPLLIFDNLDDHMGLFNYQYSPNMKSIEPFKKIKKLKNKSADKYLTIIRDINIKPLPSNIVMNNSVHRVFGQTQIRNLDDGNDFLPTTYYKFFTWNRTYNLRWDLTKSLSVDYNANSNSRIDEPNGAINTQEKKDTLWNNLRRGGRTTMYTQSLNSTYNLPINKIPIFDFISTVRVSYNATYNYTANSLIARHLGNTTSNTQVRTINGDFNFTTLYNKWKWLRLANQPKPAKPTAKATATQQKGGAASGPAKPIGKDNRFDGKQDTPGKGDKPKMGKDGKPLPQQQAKEPEVKEEIIVTDTTKMTASDKKMFDSIKGKTYTEKLQNYLKLKKLLAKQKAKAERKAARAKRGLPTTARVAGRLFTMVKRANFNYTENFGSTLPGLLDSVQYLGANWRSNYTQLPYAFGMQPSRGYLETLNSNNLLSRDSLFNTNFQQTFTSALTATATVEPFPDFRIDLNIKRDFNKAYNEMYKDTTGRSGMAHLNPFESGGTSMTFWTFNTLFQRADKTTLLTDAFYKFESNRQIISNRLGISNPYINGVQDPGDTAYAKGYSRYAQEVLIPAFLSAYSGKDASTYPLTEPQPYNISRNPFRSILPMPNWRLTYSGLHKLPFIKDHFSNITLTHAYSNTLSMNSFNSSLLYDDRLGIGYPSFIDSVSGNLIPYFFVPNITINENFGPLFDFNGTLKNGATIKVEYKQSRQLSMNLLDFRLSENRTREITVGGGLRLKKITLPINIADVATKKRDMNIRCDFSIRDDKNLIQLLDSRNTIRTRGQYGMRINPTVDYIYSQTLTVRLFYDRQQTIPFISNNFPRTTTKGGIQFRFLLGQ
jgi:cell surface protein SprA